MDDFRKILYYVILGFIAVVVVWVSFLTYAGCGYSLNNCNAAIPKVARTSIPTLIRNVPFPHSPCYSSTNCEPFGE